MKNFGLQSTINQHRNDTWDYENIFIDMNSQIHNNDNHKYIYLQQNKLFKLIQLVKWQNTTMVFSVQLKTIKFGGKKIIFSFFIEQFCCNHPCG